MSEGTALPPLPDVAVERLVESQRQAIITRARNAMLVIDDVLADEKISSHGLVYSQIERLRDASAALRRVLP